MKLPELNWTPLPYDLAFIKEADGNLDTLLSLLDKLKFRNKSAKTKVDPVSSQNVSGAEYCPLMSTDWLSGHGIITIPEASPNIVRDAFVVIEYC